MKRGKLAVLAVPLAGLLLLPLLVCGIAVGLAVASEFANEDSW